MPPMSGGKTETANNNFFNIDHQTSVRVVTQMRYILNAYYIIQLVFFNSVAEWEGGDEREGAIEAFKLISSPNSCAN